eukprot:SAG31_NODE_2283_length_6016_cov_17.773872_3_plen_144_part_00
MDYLYCFPVSSAGLIILFSCGPAEQLPFAILFGLVAAPFVDGVPGGLGYSWSSTSAMLILLSAAGAFFVNLSGTMVLGSCSPLTMMMLGQAKTGAIVFGGGLLFGQHMNRKSATGALLAIFATGTYAWQCNNERGEKKTRKRE